MLIPQSKPFFVKFLILNEDRCDSQERNQANEPQGNYEEEQKEDEPG